MADADKTTAEADLSPTPFDKPCTIATKNAAGGWNYITLPESGEGKGKGSSKNIGGNR